MNRTFIRGVSCVIIFGLLAQSSQAISLSSGAFTAHQRNLLSLLVQTEAIVQPGEAFGHPGMNESATVDVDRMAHKEKRAASAAAMARWKFASSGLSAILVLLGSRLALAAGQAGLSWGIDSDGFGWMSKDAWKALAQNVWDNIWAGDTRTIMALTLAVGVCIVAWLGVVPMYRKRTFSRMGSSDLSSALSSPKSAHRYYAIGALMERKEGVLVSGQLIQLAESDPNTNVRIAAIEALGEMRITSALKVLMKVAADAKDPAQDEAVAALGDIRSPRAANTLLKIVQDPESDGDLSLSATRGLLAIKEPTSLKVLGEMVERQVVDRLKPDNESDTSFMDLVRNLYLNTLDNDDGPSEDPVYQGLQALFALVIEPRAKLELQRTLAVIKPDEGLMPGSSTVTFDDSDDNTDTLHALALAGSVGLMGATLMAVAIGIALNRSPKTRARIRRDLAHFVNWAALGWNRIYTSRSPTRSSSLKNAFQFLHAA